jgi:hypothetical protein
MKFFLELYARFVDIFGSGLLYTGRQVHVPRATRQIVTTAIFNKRPAFLNLQGSV